MPTVGVIVNPLAGKDVRRLVSAATQTSDAAKIGIVRRVIAAAAETGAERILVANDPHRLAERAAVGLNAPVELVDTEPEGTRRDTVSAATAMAQAGTDALVVLGGDGTCRDVAIGWPNAALIAISTGTNNVFPSALDGTSAGTAAALVATAAVDLDQVARRAKTVRLRGIDNRTGDTFDDIALVEAALIHASFVGARAVTDPRSIEVVVAAVASPASTGLSAIAGRLCPCEPDRDGGVAVWLGPGPRSIRVPLAPGTFTTVEVSQVNELTLGTVVEIRGPGILAFDGERDRPIGADTTVSVSVTRTGPYRIDVGATLALAATQRRFDVAPSAKVGP